MKKPRILGLDISLNHTGVCFREEKGYKFHECNLNSKSSVQDRWLNTINEIWPYVEISDRIFIEGYSYGSKGRSVVTVSEIGGIIRWELFARDYSYVEIAPTVLKKFACGKGNVSKAIVLKEIYKRWSIDLESDHLADAFVLVKMGEALNNEYKLTKSQKEVLKKINA